MLLGVSMFSLLLHSAWEMKMAQFHPIIVHFPIALFAIALIADILNAFGKKGAFYVAHWLIIGATIMTGFAILTGLEASENFNSEDIYVHTHQVLAYNTAGLGVIYSIIRILAMTGTLIFPNVVYIGFSLVMVAMVSWTSDYGGLITRGVTPFNAKPESALSKQLKDPPEVINYTPERLEGYLEHKISVEDVVPIFAKYNCVQCHNENFTHAGYPQKFSEGEEPSHVFLSRNPDGSLTNYPHSLFYKMVILKNSMPMFEHKEAHGILPSDRLILLKWLQNGALME